MHILCLLLREILYAVVVPLMTAGLVLLMYVFRGVMLRVFGPPLVLWVVCSIVVLAWCSFRKLGRILTIIRDALELGDRWQTRRQRVATKRGVRWV